MAVRIQVKNHPERYVVVRGQVITIGRDKANDLVVDEASASDFHAEILRQDGRVLIQDLLSQAGTFVNGERLSGPRELRAWDTLRVGATELIVSDPSIARKPGWTVSIEGGHLAFSTIDLVDDLVFGRDANCDVVLAGSLISRQHARVRVAGEFVEVIDLDSVNGTFVNGRRISTAEAVHGDEIYIEPYSIRLSHALADTDLSPRSDRTEVRPSDSTDYRVPDEDFTEVLSEVPSAQLTEQSSLLGNPQIRLRDKSYVIGRLPDNDIVVPEPSVSKHHARVYFEEGWHIEDLGAANGVRVNHTVIRKAPLRHGDLIALGRCRLLFESA